MTRFVSVAKDLQNGWTDRYQSLKNDTEYIGAVIAIFPICLPQPLPHAHTGSLGARLAHAGRLADIGCPRPAKNFLQPN